MKKKILKLSLGVFFIFGFCTVTSIRAEEVLVPQVSVVKANYQDDMFSEANLPASCLRIDEQWGKSRRRKVSGAEQNIRPCFYQTVSWMSMKTIS